MSTVSPEKSAVVNLDPTVPAPMTNVAEFGFEGRFADGRRRALLRVLEGRQPDRLGIRAAGSDHPVRPRGLHGRADQRGPAGSVQRPRHQDRGRDQPTLLANFLRIRAGEQIDTSPNATSQLYYVLYGRGFAAVNGRLIKWEKGDFLTLPAGARSVFYADSEAAMYWVHDEPLLRYLGAKAREPRFRATKFRRSDVVSKLEEIASRPGANEKSRVSVLLANENQEQTLTITHVLWAMFGVLPANQEQRPHRHQSVALDLILDAPPSGCYTLLGTRLDERGNIVDPIRVDWQAGGAFTTPPGMWHAHFNETDQAAHLIPVQDAGLQTYLRSLDIKFTQRRDLVAG